MRIASMMASDQTGTPSGSLEHFGHFPSEAQKELESLRVVVNYASNSVVFIEEETCSSMMFLLEGHVKLSMNSSSGKRLILGIAAPGDTLALASSLSGSRYNVTAETIHPCKVASIDREEFLRFLTRNPSAYTVIMRELCADNTRSNEQVRKFGLAATAPAKFARLLLDWCANGQKTERGTRLSCMLTHGEIGECIGVSRETVSRMFSEFKYLDMLESRGSTLIISNRRALEAYAD